MALKNKIKRLYSIKEVAKYLSCSQDTVRRIIKKHNMTKIMIGDQVRCKIEEFEELLNIND